jgi:tetratricopeptide (TPR) repeat protein
VTKVSFDIVFKIIVIPVLLLVSPELSAQRKRKGGEELVASNTKLREAEFYFTEGEKFFILEDFAKALTYYERTLEITPNNATVHYKIAEVLTQSNQPDDLQKASLSIDQALRLEKTNKYFYLLAANIYTSLTQFDKAASIYETMLREVKGTDEYLYDLAAVYQYANRMDDAIKTYQRAETVLGINEVSSLQKQRLYLEQGKVKEGVAEGEKLIQAFPHEERYVMAFTELLSQRGLRAEAIKYLESFIVENPEAGNCKMLLAGMYRDDSQDEKAKPLLLDLFSNKEVELNSKLLILGAYNAELNQAKGKNTRDPGKESFAEDLFQRLRSEHPDEANVHIVGGDLFLSIGKNREAQKEYLAAVQTGDVNFEVWENLLYIENQLEQYDQVVKHSDQALELFPNHGMLFYFNGLGNLRKRNYPAAIASFEQAKRLSAANQSLIMEVNAHLGEAFHATKQYDKSEKAFEEVLAVDPNNHTVLNNYSFYLASRKINLEKAEKMSALLIKNFPDNPTYLDTHAWVLFAREKFRDAKKTMERAIATGKATATHFEHYGDILYKNGDIEGAVVQWEKAKGLKANSESLNKKIANRKMYE